jgi:hypothetical protein
VFNNHSRPIENVSARITLIGPDGRILAEGEAYPPLNIIPIQREIPLTAYFEEEIDSDFTASVEIDSAMPVPRSDERYLSAWIEVEDVRLLSGGDRGVVSGVVGLPRRSVAAGLVWLAAIAYEEGGRVVAVRKIELNSSLEPGTSRLFEIEIYSLGPAIQRVEVLVEARP